MRWICLIPIYCASLVYGDTLFHHKQFTLDNKELKDQFVNLTKKIDGFIEILEKPDEYKIPLVCITYSIGSWQVTESEWNSYDNGFLSCHRD